MTRPVWDYCPYCHRPFSCWPVPLWMWNGIGEKLVRCEECNGTGRDTTGDHCDDCHTLGAIEIPSKWPRLGSLAVWMRNRHVKRCAKSKVQA